MQYLVIIYLIFVLGFIVFSAAGIYHLWRFGYSGDLSKAAIVIYSLVSAGVIIATLFLVGIRYIAG